MTHHLYADDTQIYLKLESRKFDSSITELTNCLEAVQAWMGNNKLKLNPDKTEFIVIADDQIRSSPKSSFPLILLDNSMEPAEAVKNLGVILDAENSMQRHVADLCCISYYHLQELRRVVRYFSLFRSLSKVSLHRLQLIQNCAARIVTNSCRYTCITPVLRKLHWLPIQFRSEFKLATLVCKFIHTGFTKYFAPHLSTYRTTYNTRHSQSVVNFLNVPKFQPTSPLSSLASVLPLMPPLFGIHYLKTSLHHPL